MSAAQQSLAIVPIPTGNPKHPKRKGGKKQKKSKKSKRKGNGRGNPRRPRTMPSGMSVREHGALHSKTCGILDPFCPHAYGARLPNAMGVITVPMSFRTFINFTTSTTQAVGFFFNPAWNCGYATATSVGGTLTDPTLSNFAVGGTAFSSIFSQGRVVSAGFIVRNATPYNSVEGLLTFQPTIVTGGATRTGADFADLRTTVMGVTKGMEVAVISARRGLGSIDFVDAMSVSTDLPVPDYQGWMVYAAATTTVQTYSIEIVIHIEGIPASGQTAYLLAAANTQATAPSPASLTIADAAMAKIDQVVVSPAGNAKTSLSTQISNAVSSAISEVSNNPIKYGGMALEGLAALFGG